MKAISVPRLTLANLEERKENSQKKAGMKKSQNTSHDWHEVL